MIHPECNLHKERLHQQALSEILQKNGEQTLVWTHYQNEHKLVLEGLQKIPLELNINCLVPIGKQALMEGKLKHTSEILVCLGEGYFINYTAAQAIGLCNRRMKHVEKVLSYLKEERSLFESRQSLPVSCGAFGYNINEEIIEHWDEKDLNRWRAQHKEREKEYHEKISQRRQHKSLFETEEDLFRRLDELELEEELADEYYRLQEEAVGGDDSRDDDDEQEEGEEREKVGKYLASEISSSLSEKTEDKHDIIGINGTLEQGNDSSASLVEYKNQLVEDKRVSFADAYHVNSSGNDRRANHSSEKKNWNCGFDHQKINFSHSKVLPPLIEDSDRLINNPADIYNIFYRPKSILKSSWNALSQSDNITSPKADAFNKYFESESIRKSVHEDVMMKVIQERKVEITQAEAIESLNKVKPVSRFRLERTSFQK